MSSKPMAIDAQPESGSLSIPRHVGVIMDGNGRWAKARGLTRTEGHRAGVEAVRRLVDLAIRHGVHYLTIFSFSSENWSRPPEEIGFIFGLLRRFVASDLARLMEQNVRVRVIGSRDGLETGLARILDQVTEETAGNTGLELVIAFNYGARAEIVSAMRAIARKIASGALSPDEIGEETLSAHLYTDGIPDPDLIIRTSGEMRLSNFLLWQAAYAELVFLDSYWPDFGDEDFLAALRAYTDRERRFGGLTT